MAISLIAILAVMTVASVSLPAEVLAKKHKLCTFSHKNDECYGHDTSNFPKLPRGQHYGTCEERGDNNELVCDIDNDGEG
jgi:hypothetical protein